MAGTRYYIRRLVSTDINAYVTQGHIEGSWWGVFAEGYNFPAQLRPTDAECYDWIRAMGGALVSGPAPVAPAEPVPAPAPKPAKVPEYVSCDRCSARAIVTLVTHGDGLLSFCGHHNRPVQERYDVFRSARGATNDISDAGLRAVVDDFLDSAVGHHLEVTA